MTINDDARALSIFNLMFLNNLGSILGNEWFFSRSRLNKSFCCYHVIDSPLLITQLNVSLGFSKCKVEIYFLAVNILFRFKNQANYILTQSQSHQRLRSSYSHVYILGHGSLDSRRP